MCTKMARKYMHNNCKWCQNKRNVLNVKKAALFVNINAFSVNRTEETANSLIILVCTSFLFRTFVALN